MMVVILVPKPYLGRFRYQCCEMAFGVESTLFARAAFEKNGEVLSFRAARVDTQLN